MVFFFPRSQSPGKRQIGASTRVCLLVPGAEAAPEAVLDELGDFARGHLADFKRPRQVILLPELPRNALGKVQKHLIVKGLPDPKAP